MGGVARHQHLAVKIDNEKLAGKVGSVQIKNHNIFHKSLKRILNCGEFKSEGRFISRCVVKAVWPHN
jgi:hypothetical protein